MSASSESISDFSLTLPNPSTDGSQEFCNLMSHKSSLESQNRKKNSTHKIHAKSPDPGHPPAMRSISTSYAPLQNFTDQIYTNFSSPAPRSRLSVLRDSESDSSFGSSGSLPSKFKDQHQRASWNHPEVVTSGAYRNLPSGSSRLNVVWPPVQKVQNGLLKFATTSQNHVNSTNSFANSTNSFANSTNSFANSTNSFANSTNSFANSTNSAPSSTHGSFKSAQRNAAKPPRKERKLSPAPHSVSEVMLHKRVIEVGSELAGSQFPANRNFEQIATNRNPEVKSCARSDHLPDASRVSTNRTASNSPRKHVDVKEAKGSPSHNQLSYSQEQQHRSRESVPNGNRESSAERSHSRHRSNSDAGDHKKSSGAESPKKRRSPLGKKRNWKFTSAVGKPGQARETREAVSRVVNAANPVRAPPIATPMDYEKFVVEKSAQLEHDRDRDLLLFLRDDISESFVYPKERTAVASVTKDHIQDAQWLLTIDSLKHYSSPYSIITFNYAKFAGDFKKFDPPQGLSELKFESDVALLEEKMLLIGQQPSSSDVIKEGYLVVVPGESSFVDNFRSEKKRYCIVRRDEDGRLQIEVLKHPKHGSALANTQSQPPLEIKTAVQKTTKKGKAVLQVASNPENDKRTLILAAENDSELEIWAMEIDRALATTFNSKEDSVSLGSSRGASVQPGATTAQDTESLTSEDSYSSYRDPSMGMVWRGRNTAAKALHPPIVDRRNVFSLYWDLEPLKEPEGSVSTLLHSPKTQHRQHALQRNSTTSSAVSSMNTQFTDSPSVGRKYSGFVEVKPLNRTGNEANVAKNEESDRGGRSSSPSPSISSFTAERPAILFVAEVQNVNIKMTLGAAAPAQIEPFFIRLFLFDAGMGVRISEEFHMNVCPPDLANPGSAGSEDGHNSTIKVNGISRNVLLHSNANKLICHIPNPRPDIFLVVKIERLLSDFPTDLYTKSAGVSDTKTATRLSKSIKTATQKLAHYRSSFAWTVRPVFPSMCHAGGGFGTNAAKTLQLYKCDSRLNETDLQKYLNEFAKLEKSGKLNALPGASMTVDVDITSSVADLPMRISPSLLPLRPWRAPPDSPLAPAFELQSFVTESLVSEPFKSLVNLLYVYPTTLSYGSQKAFSRARNIACTVKFVSGSQQSAKTGSPVILDRNDSQQGPFVASKTCAVQYHEQNPQFDDEIKVQLPCALETTDHLLFEFTHISVANALSPKSSHEQAIESSIGYAWLPLVRSSNDGCQYLIMSEDSESFDLPVAVNLPPGYVKCQGPGQTREPNAPDVKFVENGRPLFRVRLRLISSVYSSNERVQAFFQCCQTIDRNCPIIAPSDDEHNLANNNRKFSSTMTGLTNRSCSPYVECGLVEAAGSDASSMMADFKRIIEKMKALACVEDIYHLIPFLHTILNRLLTLLVCTNSDEVAMNALNVLVVIVDRIGEHKSRHDILRQFIYYHLRYIISVETDETTHGALCKYVPMLIRNVQGDNKAIGCIFRQLWFFIDCTVKCMSQWLIRNKLFKAPRRERFPAEVIFRIEGLVQLLTTQIIAKHKDLPMETRQANVSLANFLKYCLSLTDRFTIMNEIHYVIEKLDGNNSRALRVYKLELLQIISGHEHWLPLCLPLLTDKNGSVMRGDPTTLTDNGPLSAKPTAGGFLSKFFAQIFSTNTAIQESTEADRYANYVEHFYLSPTYCQTHFLAGIVFQELASAIKDPREYRRQVVMLTRNLLAKHSGDSRYTDSSTQNRIAVLYTPIIRLAIENIRELEATAKTSADSPDHSPAPNLTATQLKSRSLTADHKASATQMLDNANSATATSSLSGMASLGMPKALRSSSKASTLPSQTPSVDGSQATTSGCPQSNNPATIAAFAEKLDKNESRDLLLCVLFVLNKLPKKTIGALWCSQESMKHHDPNLGANLSTQGSAQRENSSNTSTSNVYLDFIRLLELALFMFRYRGRPHHEREHARRQKAAMKVAVNFQTDQRSFTLDSHLSSTSTNVSSTQNIVVNALNVDEDASTETSLGVPSATTTSFLQESNLTQEVALIVLEVSQTLANQIATRAKQLNMETIDAAFQRLLELEIQLLGPNWPENVRLHALAGLAVFINLFSSRFFQSGPLEPLSSLIEALLLQLNCRFPRVQNAAAALLQLVLRNGFDVASSIYAKQAGLDTSAENSASASATDRLGRPGSQTGVALAYLLGHKPPLLTPTSTRFDRGLKALESLVLNFGERRAYTLFEKGVLELIKQLRGVLEATSAISEAANDPIRLADLHIQLANSYRGSAALRCAWFDSLASAHIAEQWYSEAAVCQAHAIAIMGKELVAKGFAKIDWSLLDMINDKVASEENVYDDHLDSTQQANYTVENFTKRIEKTMETLVLSERYEAVGPLCRMAIPIYEQRHDYKALVSLYAELQQANSRAAEVKASGKRHLGSYFRVVFLGEQHFGPEHNTEWVYREPKLTSLAEACDRMVESVRHALGHDQVEILPPEKKHIEVARLNLSTAYIQVGHVEPCSAKMLQKNSESDKTGADVGPATVEDDDPMCYRLHTNVKNFVYEERMTDDSVPSTAPEQAKLAVRRIVLTVEKSFPNTRRRQKVLDRTEFILNPLELACDSLLFKAAQIRRILNAAGIMRGAYGFDKSALRRLDVKQLQLFLQGSVSPTVNAGVLAYAEAFTAPEQRHRYGNAGIAKLVSAFKILMTELSDALKINEAAMGSDRSEYQSMLRNSFDGMVERLSAFFNGEKFILDPFSKGSSAAGDDHLDGNAAALHSRSSAMAMHILDSIGGVNT